MILTDVLELVLNHSAHVQLLAKTTMQGYKNMATTTQITTYIATTRQKDKERAV